MRYCLDIFEIISKTILDPEAQFMHGVEGHFSTGGAMQSRTALVYSFDMMEIRFLILVRVFPNLTLKILLSASHGSSLWPHSLASVTN